MTTRCNLRGLINNNGNTMSQITTESIKKLDLLTFPLAGNHLIEASAGTGKTYTIASLYVRLILGAADENDSDSPIPPQMPSSILVVTFTEAATEELRDRIRRRLEQAAAVFRSPLNHDDPFLQQLRQRYAQDDPKKAAAFAYRLDQAAQAMDQAAIYTIHAFCQKMLRTHAFDSQSLFELKVNTDDIELKQEAARDYWRVHVQTLQEPLLQSALTILGNDPLNVLNQVRPLLTRGTLDLNQPPTTSLAVAISQIDSVYCQRLAALRQPWREGWLDTLATALTQTDTEKQFNGSRIKSEKLQRWLSDLAIWVNSDQAQPLLPVSLKEEGFWKYLSPNGIAAALKKNCVLITNHPDQVNAALAALAELPSQIKALPSLTLAVWQHAAQWIGHRLHQEKQRRAEIGFDDMITRLDQALANTSTEAENPLAKVLRCQFPLAMIDEFQDTDPAQYRIFSTIYPDQNSTEHGLLLIGDPKQAIYAFRGADIFTYIHARQVIQPAHRTTLDTNHRSSAPLVKAVNQLFSHADTVWKDGDGVFFHEQIPFFPVQSRHQSLALTIDNTPLAAIDFHFVAGLDEVNSTDYRYLTANHTAQQIANWLASPEQVHLPCGDKDATTRPIRAEDIAILVRSGREADIIRQALSRYGVRSVYLSDRDSVFQSQQAADMVLWLEAVVYPEDGNRVRRALATPSLAWSWQQLEQLVVNETFWEQQIKRFRDYRLLWQKNGVLAMLRQLLLDEAVPQRVLQETGGERVMTNFLHLAERLQADSAHLEGEQGLIRHLNQLIEQPNLQQQEAILRLESEANLVKVVTIHKSKGLEYPVVFLPFVCAIRVPMQSQTSAFFIHQPDGSPCFIAKGEEATPAQWQQFVTESQAEEMRLLYVALTRAKYHLALGMAAVVNRQVGVNQTAIGRLFGMAQPWPAEQWLHYLSQLQDEDPACFAVSTSPRMANASRAQINADDTLTTTEEAKKFTGTIDHSWWIASYSALLPDRHQRHIFSQPHPVIEDEGTVSMPVQRTPTPVNGVLQDIHRFEAGPRAGVFLHGLLQWAAEYGFAAAYAHDRERKRIIALRCQRRDLSEWVEVFDGWLKLVLDTPLCLDEALPKLRLADLAPHQVQTEMEFMLSIDAEVKTSKLEQMIHPLFADAPRTPLNPRTLHGMFKGYIDLVIEHAGRYFVLDYKSNRLGKSDDDYQPAAMQAAMLQHRYDVQGVCYTLALHRLLQNRLTNYQPQHHLGGFVCFFIRGIESASQGLMVKQPSPTLISQLDQLFSGR